MTTRTKVFISYAREDQSDARRLFEDLKGAGLDPWIDIESLLPGQRWGITIRQAMRESRYFLALLSSNSVKKKGFLQKEIKEALDILDEFPETHIFFIPVRLEDCEPPYQKLHDLQWVDMFHDWDSGLRKLLSAILTEEESLFEKSRLSKNDLNDLDKQILEDMGQNRDIYKRWVLIGIGGGGGRVVVDLILSSRYLRHIINSVYFLNTSSEDIVDLRIRLGKAFRNQRIWYMDGKESVKTGVPVNIIKFALFGTGNDFVRSRRLLEMYVLGEKKEEKSETRIEESVGKRRILEGLAEIGGIQEKKESSAVYRKGPQMYPSVINCLKCDLIESKNVILVHSLGGGTGGGGAPVLARWIREHAGFELRESTVISICFLASRIDGPLRMANSLHNLMRISKEADIVLLFSNEILLHSAPYIKSSPQKEEYRRINEKIVKTSDIFFSSAAAPGLGGCTSLCYEPTDLKTYLRMLFDSGGSLFPVNIAIPFVSIGGEKDLEAPIALGDALDAGQVSILKGSLMSLVPFFLSSSRKVCKEEFHSKNLDLYNKMIEIRGLQDKYDFELGPVIGVADPGYWRDSENNINVLALGLAKLDLEEYKDALKNPRTLTLWERFLEGEEDTCQELVQRIIEWNDNYNQKIDEFNSKMAEYSKRKSTE